AIEKIENLENEIQKINKISASQVHEEFQKDIQETKKSILSLISYPKTEKVFSVFNDKLDKFSKFVVANNWRTLSRVSERLLNLTQGRIQKNKLKTIVSDIEKDLSYMEKVTENSILSRADKS